MQKKFIKKPFITNHPKGPYSPSSSLLPSTMTSNTSLLYGTLQTPKQNLITEIGNLNQLSVEGTSTFFGQTNFYNKLFLSNLSTHQCNIGVESNLNVFGRIHLFDSLIIPENDIMMKTGKIYLGKKYLMADIEENRIECHGDLKLIDGDLIFSDGSKQKKGFEMINPSPKGEYSILNAFVNEYGQIIKAKENKEVILLRNKSGITTENYIGILTDSVPSIQFDKEYQWKMNEYILFRIQCTVFYKKNQMGIYEKVSSFSGTTFFFPGRFTSSWRLESYQPSKFKLNNSIVGKNIFHFVDSRLTPKGRPYWTITQNPVIGDNDIFFIYGDEHSLSLQIINPNGWDTNEDYDYLLNIEILNTSNVTNHIKFISFD